MPEPVSSEPLEEPRPVPLSRTALSILDAAEFLFLRQGYHGTSMRQLARYAGITPAAIYNHFGSKEDLFIALLQVRLPHQDLAKALRRAEGETAADLLRDGLARVGEALQGREGNLRLAMIELLELDGRHLSLVLPEILTAAEALLDRLRASDPRLEAWSPDLVLRVVGGAFFGLAVSQSLASGTDDSGTASSAFDGLSAILSAGLLHGRNSYRP